MSRRKAYRFYTDDRGRVRPITRGSVAAALASGVRVRRVTRFKVVPLRNPSDETKERFRKAAGRGRSDPANGLLLDRRRVVGLVTNAERFRNSSTFGRLASLPEKGDPTAIYPRIYISKMSKYGLYVVGEDRLKTTLVRGRALKTALRALGTRNIRAYLTESDMPVLLVNEAGEAVVLSPTIGYSAAAHGTPKPLPVPP